LADLSIRVDKELGLRPRPCVDVRNAMRSPLRNAGNAAIFDAQRFNRHPRELLALVCFGDWTHPDVHEGIRRTRRFIRARLGRLRRPRLVYKGLKPVHGAMF